MPDIATASNSMTSRCVHTWKLAEKEGRDGTHHQITPARRSSQRLLASTAGCKKQWLIASLDINVAFLKGLTYQELAEATGEKERVA
eukprot:4066520-Pyramimonas_sp.AAC.1